jgi:aldehyde dehydrogenase (NAD+)
MNTINAVLHTMREYFFTGSTQSIAFRKQQLHQLKNSITKYEADINDALYKDLHKSKEEVWLTETGTVLSEINYSIKHLESWMSPKKVRTNLANLPGKSYIIPEPLGVVLIIAPWNYPFQLLLMPLVGAIAAGNCAVVKPSEFATATEQLMQKIIEETFDFRYVACITGDGATVIPEMMNNFRFDHVFYTGSPFVGKIIYQMAAAQLVPVTLELGGKSPCVVTANANLKVAAKRIAFVKFSNTGQMCIAPDYLLVHASVMDELVKILIKTILNFYTDNPANSYDFGRIINQKQFKRLQSYISDSNVLFGGMCNEDELYIEPTLIENPSMESPIMKEEIFGPLLPVLTYKTEEEAVKIIQQNINPLAFYVFTDNKKEADEWLQKVPSGNASVNAAAVFYLNKKLPFGGRGNSGMGRYHGKFSFDTFSHQKAVLKKTTWPDLAIAYPSYKGKLRILKILMK